MKNLLTVHLFIAIMFCSFLANAQVTIYADADCKGSSHSLSVGEHNDSNLWNGIGNDNISSIKVQSGYKAILYNDGGLRGDSREYTSDNNFISDFNNSTSSIKVVALNAASQNFTPANGKLYIIRSKKDNNKVLDAFETDLRVWSKNLSPAQKFKFVSAGSDANGIPLYYIQSYLNYTADNSPKSIEVKDAGTSKETSIVCRIAEDKMSQKFRIFDEGNGYVSFSPAHCSSNMALDLYAGKTDDGSPIKLWDTNGTKDHRLFKLEDVGTDDTNNTPRKTLFIYFNGSDKQLNHQLTQFATMVDADVQIYVNGVGSDNNSYHSHNLKGIKFLHVDKRMNSYSDAGVEYHADFNTFTKQGSNARIYGINRDYDGSAAKGYDNQDSKQICREVLKLLQVYKVKDIERIVISGHSRGSAVGIASFLFALKKAEENNPEFAEFKPVVQAVFGGAQQINVVSLDPVAGPTNDYHMGNDWHIDQAYSYLKGKYSNITFSEVYANAARMVDHGVSGFASFTPSKFFLHQSTGIDVHRFWLGFRHSSMVHINELMYQYYDENDQVKKRPVHLTAEYLNAAFNNQSLFRNKSTWTDKFFQNDLAAYLKAKSISDDDYDELKNHYPKRHANFENELGQSVNMDSFVSPHSLPQ